MFASPPPPFHILFFTSFLVTFFFEFRSTSNFGLYLKLHTFTSYYSYKSYLFSHLRWKFVVLVFEWSKAEILYGYDRISLGNKPTVFNSQSSSHWWNQSWHGNIFPSTITKKLNPFFVSHDKPSLSSCNQPLVVNISEAIL